MTIMLDQDVVEEALVAYITGEGINTSNKDISVNIISGRQGNGCKAEVTLTTKPAITASVVEKLVAVAALEKEIGKDGAESFDAALVEELKKVTAEATDSVVEESIKKSPEEGSLFKNAP